MSDFWSAGLGAALGLGTGLSLEWWKSGREDIRDLCRGFAQLVAEAADAGAQFWMTAGKDPGATLALARVIGFQNRIAGYGTVLNGRLDEEDMDEIETKLAALFGALTGDDPQDDSRAASFPKACQVHETASAAIIAIRVATYTRMSFRERIARYCRRSWTNRSYIVRMPGNPFPGDSTSGR